MMDSSYHGYDWVMDELPFDAPDAEEVWQIEQPMQLAQNNMKQWMRDIEIGPVHGFSAMEIHQNVDEPPVGDRYHFTVTGQFRPRGWSWPSRIAVSADVWMPGVSIHMVRFIDPEKQNPWKFMKVIYNGYASHWDESIWDFVRDCEETARRS